MICKDKEEVIEAHACSLNGSHITRDKCRQTLLYCYKHPLRHAKQYTRILDCMCSLHFAELQECKLFQCHHMCHLHPLSQLFSRTWTVKRVRAPKRLYLALLNNIIWVGARKASCLQKVYHFSLAAPGKSNTSYELALLSLTRVHEGLSANTACGAVANTLDSS